MAYEFIRGRELPFKEMEDGLFELTWRRKCARDNGNIDLSVRLTGEIEQGKRDLVDALRAHADKIEGASG